MREVGGEEICAPHLRSGVAGGRGGWEGERKKTRRGKQARGMALAQSG